MWGSRAQASGTRQRGVCFWGRRGTTVTQPTHLAVPEAARGPAAQPPPGTSAVQGLGWKKPGSRLIRPDLRNTITSFKTKQLPARAFLPEPPEQPHPRGDRPEETQETVSLRTQARWCTRVHACLGACTHVHACLGACTRWKQCLRPPTHQPGELWPPHQGREVGITPAGVLQAVPWAGSVVPRAMTLPEPTPISRLPGECRGGVPGWLPGRIPAVQSATGGG